MKTFRVTLAFAPRYGDDKCLRSIALSNLRSARSAAWIERVPACGLADAAVGVDTCAEEVASSGLRSGAVALLMIESHGNPPT